jgi:hypothetical protein
VKCHAMMLTVMLVFSTVARAEVSLLENSKARVQIVADVRGATPAGSEVLKDAAGWLAESLKRASGVTFVVADDPGDQSSLVVARVDQWPDVARAAGLTSRKYDDYAITTRSDERRIYVLGNSEEAARFG